MCKKWTNTLEVDFQSLGVVSWGEDVSLFCPVFYAAMMTRILSQGRPQKPGYGVVVENITGRGRVKGGSKWQKVWEGGGSTPEGTEGGGLESHQVVCKCWSPTSTGRVPQYQLLFYRTDVAFSSRLEKWCLLPKTPGNPNHHHRGPHWIINAAWDWQIWCSSQIFSSFSRYTYMYFNILVKTAKNPTTKLTPEIWPWHKS